MRRILVRVLLAVGLIGMGWSIGRAQAPLPDFELVIDAPEGRTNVDCVRGCEGLAWIERMVPGTVPPSSDTVFSYACSNSGNARCGSGRIGGWLKR
jgi:hypothetical protein